MHWSQRVLLGVCKVIESYIELHSVVTFASVSFGLVLPMQALSYSTCLLKLSAKFRQSRGKPQAQASWA